MKWFSTKLLNDQTDSDYSLNHRRCTGKESRGSIIIHGHSILYTEKEEDYIQQISIDLIKENAFILKKAKSRRYPAETLINACNADELALLASTPRPSRIPTAMPRTSS